MTDRVLIIEDDSDIAKLIEVNLQDLGIKTCHCSNGHDGLQEAIANRYDLLLLDLMLPGISGLDICQQVRNQLPEQAIIMLTAKTSETDRVVGLELGADDYMIKPFSVRELQARVRSQLRRVHLMQRAANLVSENHPTTTIEHGALHIDEIGRTASWKQQSLDLTSTEFDLLRHFAAHPNQVYSRSQLLDAVWGYQHSGYEHTVNSHINRLRSKLEFESTSADIVQTVWGVGYKLNSRACHE